ncbi:MAG: TetR/AcrR family transcriptional regulator [Rhodothermales bacterium]
MAGRPKTFDPDEVLDRALHLFWQRGYAATSLHALLEAMQISRQSLYNTFGDKQTLYRQALRRYEQQRFAQVKHILGQPGPVLANIRGLLQIWADLTAMHPFPGCFMHNTTIELGPHDSEWEAMGRRHLQVLEQIFVDALQQAQAEGELPDACPIERQARALVTTFQGMLALGKAGMDAAWVQDVVDAALAPLEG